MSVVSDIIEKVLSESSIGRSRYVSRRGIDNIVKSILERRGNLFLTNPSINLVSSYEEFEFNGIQFIVAYVKDLNSSYATTMTNGKYGVLLPPCYTNLSFNAAKFALLHEIGHIYNGDVDLLNADGSTNLFKFGKLFVSNLARPFVASLGFSFPMETRADMYAMKYSDASADNAKQYLTEFINLLNQDNYVQSIALKEIELRYEALKRI